MGADHDLPRHVARLLDADELVTGAGRFRLEARLAEECGVEHGVATTNRTTALHAAFAALDIGSGDRVLVSPLAFVGAVNALALHGATPVFGDVHPGTFTLDPYTVEHLLQHVRRPIDAILVSHTFGLVADIGPLAELAAEHDLDVIEDVGPGVGASHDGRPVGSFGDVSCLSCYPLDDRRSAGGAVLTDRDDLADRVRRFVAHGRRVSPRSDDPGTDSSGAEHADVDVVEPGTDARPTNFFAAVALMELERLPDRLAVRRSNARRLTDRLVETPVRTPIEPPDRRHAYTRYQLLTDDRDGLGGHLRSHGIEARSSPLRCVHHHPAYEDAPALATIAERSVTQFLSLPVHDPLTDDEIDRIAREIDAFLGGG